MLPKIPNGNYDTDECFEQKSPFGTNCTITCDDGFELKGPTTKTCESKNGRNGVWSQKNKVTRCADILPPNIICPDNYTLELSGNKSFILLSSFHPLKVMEGNENIISQFL
jgi:CUB/sushi domain-containing protein